MELTSTRNPLLQKIRRAAAAGRATEEGLVVAEGPHLLAEALRGEWAIEQVFVSVEGRQRYRDLLARTQAEIIEVSARALASAAETETPQNVITLVRPRAWAWGDVMRGPALTVVLDRIQDPGNVGTIVRSAEAFAATGVVLLKGCARVANGKVLRASAGSIFRIPFLEDVSAGNFMQNVGSSGLRVFALAAQGNQEIRSADLRGACAVVVGSEGSGVAPELRARAEGLSIPTATVESLNAAVACSIALYEAGQQRQRA